MDQILVTGRPLDKARLGQRGAPIALRAPEFATFSLLLGIVLPNQCSLPAPSQCSFQGLKMSQSPPAPPSLEVLRKEIDTIDEQVHRLLMARGDIIDRLISVEQTQEVGSASRPAREAEMMRRLVQRHRGILPLDTVESIWRVIISTFTYVQAPFSVHADISLGESAMRDSARFHFGFTVPYVSHFSAPAAVEAVANSKGDLALVSAASSPPTRRRCRYSWSRASPTAPWSPKSRCGACGCRAGTPKPRARCRRWRKSSRSPIPPLTARH